MGTTLSIIAIVLLLALVAYSMIKQRAGTAEMRSENEARIAGQDDQHERSMSRRAEARAAHDADA
jgi:hypothetical protein